jgi:hypothetical protein
MGAGREIVFALAFCVPLLAFACEAPVVGGEPTEKPQDDSEDEKPDAHAPAVAAPAASAPPAPAASTHAPTSCRGGGCGDASVDASVTQTFNLGSNDCNAGHCNGGYGGRKDDQRRPTADKQCVDRGFTHALDFTIGGEPGGRFCVFSNGTYGCDGSCSGCNIMKTVTCIK